MTVSTIHSNAMGEVHQSHPDNVTGARVTAPNGQWVEVKYDDENGCFVVETSWKVVTNYPNGPKR